MEEKKVRSCPVCGSKLKKGDKMVYCENYKPRKQGNEWYNEGDCDFRITYKNKMFGRDLTDKDIKTLLDGGTIRTKNAELANLDLEEPSFIHIQFKEKAEDKDFI